MDICSDHVNMRYTRYLAKSQKNQIEALVQIFYDDQFVQRNELLRIYFCTHIILSQNSYVQTTETLVNMKILSKIE